MSWNDSQLRILRALGHEPMVLAPPGSLIVGAAFSRDSALEAGEEQSRQNVAPTSTQVLEQAIARAAGGRELAALALDLERLRREPALKRALWPQLRRLLRSH